MYMYHSIALECLSPKSVTVIMSPTLLYKNLCHIYHFILKGIELYHDVIRYKEKKSSQIDISVLIYVLISILIIPCIQRSMVILMHILNTSGLNLILPYL